MRGWAGAGMLRDIARHGVSSMIVSLDLRQLPPPEPMERILDALDALPPGARLQALTPFRPVPLLPMLEQAGFAFRIEDAIEGHAVVTIWRRDDVAAAAAGSSPAESSPAGSSP